MKEETILSAKEIEKNIERVSNDIFADYPDTKDINIVGIKTRGEYLGKRITANLNDLSGGEVPFGTIDITLYRDDLRNNLSLPELKGTDIPFDVENKVIILVDDVLFTGRTIRAAIDAIMDFGRPSHIKLAVLVDRGLRELPIQAYYTGISIETKTDEKIKVLVKEKDKKDKVVLES